jgi:ferrochelatase
MYNLTWGLPSLRAKQDNSVAFLPRKQGKSSNACSVTKNKENRPVMKTGLLLINLGSPSSPEPAAVKRYLVEFLSDPLVVDLPRWLWLPLLHLVIAPLRSKKSARAYQKIWTAEGSPLVTLTMDLADKVRAALNRPGSLIIVEAAMRYGEPDVAGVLAKLEQRGIDQLVVLPLYPQFSATTTESAFDVVRKYYGRGKESPEIHYIRQYHDQPAWTAAIAASVEAWQQDHGRADILMFSFHGLPERLIAAGDPYHDQCEASVRNIVAALELGESEYLLSFQSRVGAEKWLAPYTNKELIRLAASGVKRVQVICPGFSIDCLETLEEIAMQNRDLFLAAGGDALEYIPALNDSDAQVELVLALLDDWLPQQATPVDS